jgi:hypothetical protein
VIISTLGLKEIWELQKRWREVFAKRYFYATGRWVRGADRHIFNERYFDRFSVGPAAELDYQHAEEASMIYVVGEGGRYGEAHDCKPSLAQCAEIGATIFPGTLVWTAAVGPDYCDPVYFARASWVGDYHEHDG